VSEEILINVTPRETRVAQVENGLLREVFIERSGRRGIVGNVYKGKVCRVLPGMQAAFVDAGLERAAFLHCSDITGRREGDDDSKNVSINELVSEGQEIIVQVVKDPLGTKGARLTTQLSIPSRYLVYLSNISNVGVSQKIDNDEERRRLKAVLTDFVSTIDCGGFIARTAAEGVSEEALKADMDYLYRLWTSINDRGKGSGCGVIHEDLPLALRALRDFPGPDIEKVRIDSKETYDRAREFAQSYIPEAIDKLEYYPGERPLFELFGIEDEIHRALDRNVQLKSGGHLVFDQTEAMTTIDVNTGAFVGHRNLEETIFKTNLEAAQAIARQLQLRNLGGIIIIDFIDMTEPEHKRQVLRALEKSLESDHTKTTISEVSALGLVQMTRKRTRESLAHILCETCPVCQGRGELKTPETVCYEVFRELLREARQFDAQQFLVLASQDVVDMLLDEEATSLAELEAFINKPIKLQVESLYTQEQYDVVLM
jgi:ribonuclease G